MVFGVSRMVASRQEGSLGSFVKFRGTVVLSRGRGIEDPGLGWNFPVEEAEAGQVW